MCAGMRVSVRSRVGAFLAIAAVSVGAAEFTLVDRWMSVGFREGRGAADVVNTVVIHFSSNVLANRTSPYDVDAVIATYAAADCSSHYLIGRDGTVYRLVDEAHTAYHAGAGTWRDRKDNLNPVSIGIELMGIGSAEEMEKMVGFSREEYMQIPKEHLGFTDAQYRALERLLKDIQSRHPAIQYDRQHIIGHDEYAPCRKQDPGSLFDWGKLGLAE